MTRAHSSVERRVAVAAVRDASRACRAVREALRPEQAAAKPDRSPVTVADLASQAIISLALADALPDDAVMGEEDDKLLTAPWDSPIAVAVLDRVTALRPEVEAERIAWALRRCADEGGPVGRHWELDPVDGTKGFLRGGQYAVALGLVEDGEVVLGVLGCPNLPFEPADPAGGTGCVFVAELGGGTWQLPLDDAGGGGEAGGRQVRVCDVIDAACATWVESLEPGHADQAAAAAIAEILGASHDPVRMDSQAKYAVVARGDASIYLRMQRGSYIENAWDHAAGSLIVAEAGGRVSDADGVALDFGTGRRLTRNRGIVAAPAAIHEQVIAAVARAMYRSSGA